MDVCILSIGKNPISSWPMWEICNGYFYSIYNDNFPLVNDILSFGGSGDKLLAVVTN
jgi:hypothetical protein